MAHSQQQVTLKKRFYFLIIVCLLKLETDEVMKECRGPRWDGSTKGRSNRGVSEKQKLLKSFDSRPFFFFFLQDNVFLWKERKNDLIRELLGIAAFPAIEL